MEGLNNVIVRATDVAGNTNDTTFSFTLDTSTAVPVVALANDTGSSGTDQVTNDPSLTLTGIESGATVEYSLDGGSNWSTSAPTLAQLVQGANTVEVRQTDLAGNVSTPASFAFTLDTVAPTGGTPALTTGSDSGTSASDSITKVINPTFQVALNPAVAVGDTVELLLGGSALAHDVTHTVTAGDITAGSVSLTVTAGDLGTDGAKSITAKFTDAAGNTSTTAADVITLDTTAPTIAVTNPIAGDNIIDTAEADAGIVISGTTIGVENGQIATIQLVDGSDTVVDSFNATVTGNAWSVTVSPAQALTLANGTYTVKADVSDQAGNQAPEATHTLTVDETAVSIAIAAIAGDNTINAAEASAGFAISGITTGVEDGQTATIQLVDSSDTVVDSFDATVTGNAWSVNVTPVQAQALADGIYMVKADVADQANNQAPQAAQALMVDETVPAAPGVALSNDTGSSGSDQVTNDASLTLTGIESGATVEYSLDGGSNWSTSAPTLAQLVQGSNTVEVRQTDLAGNVSSAGSLTFTLDTSTAAPGVALTTDSGSSASDHITNVGTLALSGLEAGATVSYSIDGGTTFTSSFSAVEGLNNVIVRATDVAGNTNDTAFSFTLDTSTAAPAVALTTDSGSSSSDHITNVGTLALSGLEAGATVSYSIDGGTNFTGTFSAVEGPQQRHRAGNRRGRQHQRHRLLLHPRHQHGGAGGGADHRQRQQRQRPHHQ